MNNPTFEEYKNKGASVRITGVSNNHVNYVANLMGVKIRKHYQKNNESIGYGYFKVHHNELTQGDD